jgi:hypothetical protein
MLFMTDPRVIIERTIIERNIFDVFYIETSFYRLVLLSKAGVQGAAAP